MPYGGNTTGVSLYNVRCFIRDDDGAGLVPVGTPLPPPPGPG